MSRFGVAAIAVALVWTVLDFVMHGVILRSAYEATAGLWRPMAEAKPALMNVVTLIAAGAFTAIYAGFVASKSVRTGLLFGAIFGLGTGVSMAYGTYAFLPIPYTMALTWFLGAIVKGAAGGALLGVLVKPVQVVN